MTSEKSKMGKGKEHLQITNLEIKELQDSLHELDKWVVDLNKQIDLNDRLIQAFQLKLIENEKKNENTVDVTCDIDDLIKMVDVTCDTHDLIVDTNATKCMVDDSLTSHEIESYNELMKISLVDDESQAEAQSDGSNDKCEFEVIIENVYEAHQNGLSKMIVTPWEEMQLNKNQHGLRYDKGIIFHIPNNFKPVQFVSA
jgi:hypothetical protein